MPAIISRSPAVDVVLRFLEAYNSHDVPSMLAACGRAATVHYVPMGSHGVGGAQDVGKMIWAGLIDAFPDLHVSPRTAFGNDTRAAAEVVIGGTQQKDFLNVPNRGWHYELPHAFLFEIDDAGRLTSIIAYWDNVSFYRQLGKTTFD